MHHIVKLAEMLLVFELSAQVYLLHISERRSHMFCLKASRFGFSKNCAVASFHGLAQAVVKGCLQITRHIRGGFGLDRVLATLELSKVLFMLLLLQLVEENGVKLIHFIFNL